MDTIAKMGNSSLDLVITSPPYNIGKPYETIKEASAYVEWIAGIISALYPKIKNSGSICFQVGNMVHKGKVFPIDCLLFSSFIEAAFIPRNRIIWSFGHGLHCKNRFSGRHEVVMWFTKSEDYFFNVDAVRVPQKYPGKKHFKGDRKGQLSCNPLGKNPGDVWEISNVKNNHPEKTDHPCQFPEALIKRLVLSLCPAGGVVYDPMAGSGTVGKVAQTTGRDFILSESKIEYEPIIYKRLNSISKLIF